MATEARRRVRWLALLALLGGAGGVGAQILVFPLGSTKAGAGTASTATAKQPSATGVVPGQGAGEHSPDSPFKPLPVRSDVVSWAELTAAKPQYRHEYRRMVPVFPPAIRARHQTVQRIQGFMMPLTPGVRHTVFLVSSVPLNCAFCRPGGPESMVEVHTKAPVPYAQDGLVVEGRLEALVDDPSGLYYRLMDAKPVK